MMMCRSENFEIAWESNLKSGSGWSRLRHFQGAQP